MVKAWVNKPVCVDAAKLKIIRVAQQDDKMDAGGLLDNEQSLGAFAIMDSTATQASRRRNGVAAECPVGCHLSSRLDSSRGGWRW